MAFSKSAILILVSTFFSFVVAQPLAGKYENPVSISNDSAQLGLAIFIPPKHTLSKRGVFPDLWYGYRASFWWTAAVLPLMSAAPAMSRFYLDAINKAAQDSMTADLLKSTWDHSDGVSKCSPRVISSRFMTRRETPEVSRDTSQRAMVLSQQIR